MTAFWLKFRSPCSERRKIGAAWCYASLKAVSYELFQRNRPLDAWRNLALIYLLSASSFSCSRKSTLNIVWEENFSSFWEGYLLGSRSFVVFTWKKEMVKKGRMLLKRILFWNWWQVNMKDTVHQSLYLHCVHELLNLNWWTEFHHGLRNRVDTYFDIGTSIT